MGLDTVEFILWSEEEFGIAIPDEDASHIVTVGELCKYLAARLAVKDGVRALPYRRILEKVSARLESAYKIPRERITEQARFVSDLGLD